MSTPVDSLHRKVVLVTGGGSGIGRAIALAAAAEGATVMVADLVAQTARETVDMLGAGARASAVRVDCADVTSIDHMVAATVAEFGSVDVLVNCAGVVSVADLLDVSEAHWDLIQSVNARGTFFALQRAARQMIEQGRGGRIVNIASIAGQGYAQTSSIAYAASKGAVLTLTRIAAHRLARHAITVNAVNPGITLTGLVSKIVQERSELLGAPEERVLVELEASIPLGRVNTPEEVAAMVVYLAGANGSGITGQSFNIDGGLVMS